MSVSGIFNGNFTYSNTQSAENTSQQIQPDFEQLGQALESGNLSAAQEDFATLEQLLPENNSTAAAASNHPMAQAFNRLSQDLKSGNLSAAQQAYANIQQDFQSQAPQKEGHHHHTHPGGSEFSQLFSQLGQALTSGNLSAAQQAFATLQQDFGQWNQNSQAAQSSSTTASTTAS
jgi:outer membrane protein assembly factor BamD (BamD/ComL family)